MNFDFKMFLEDILNSVWRNSVSQESDNIIKDSFKKFLDDKNIEDFVSKDQLHEWASNNRYYSID